MMIYHARIHLLTWSLGVSKAHSQLVISHALRPITKIEMRRWTTTNL